MINRKTTSLFIITTTVISSFVLSGCAFTNYFSRINNTPAVILESTLESSPTLIPFTITPTLEHTSTITPTPTPTEIPTITPTPTATPCGQSAGSIQKVQVPSSALGVPLPVSIYFPPCYDPTGNYPVLYLLHGQNMDDQYWIDLGAPAIADEAILNGQTPFIIVFPNEVLNFDDNFTSSFPDAILNDLIPWVDANYATCTERICRSIGGISRGGGWAIKLTMRNFDLFGTLGGHSFGLMYGDASWVNKQLETHTAADFPRIYLDRGEKDSLASDIDYYVKTLQTNGIKVEFHINPGSHTHSYWRSHVQEYMAFYMASWPEPFGQP